jgi:hypothetical protein
VSNENIRFENEELKLEVNDLKENKKVLIDEINHLKHVVLNDIAAEIRNMRKSFELYKNNKIDKIERIGE